MEATVELHGLMRDAVDRKRLSLSVDEGATAGRALAAVAEAYEGFGPLVFDSRDRLRPNVNVSVGGTPVRDRDGAATSIEDGDTLIVAPAVAGG